MLLSQMVEALTTEFKKALEQNCQDLDLCGLTPDVAETVGHALQDALARAGAAAYTLFLSSYETTADIVRGPGGEMYRYKYTSTRPFLTLFGPIVLSRRLYQNAGDTKSYVPLDAAWGMQGEYLTPPVREAILYACALGTPAEAERLLAKSSLFRPDLSTIKREVSHTGERIQAHREQIDQAVHAQEPVPEEVTACVVSADGAMVLMNEAGVHFGRPGQRPDREAPDTKPTAYRVAMVGAVSLYGPPNTAQDTPERLLSRYVAHMPESGCPTFKTLLEAEVDATVSKLPASVPLILLLDGSRDLWHYFDTHPRYTEYFRCLDFWHCAEHLAVAAEALFGSGKQARTWYEKYRRILRDCDHGAQRVLNSIAYYASRHQRSSTAAKHLEEERTFFRRNRHRMPYATFRKNGWPIGSGPIEAACKTLVKSRMCRSGMRWKRQGGQHILNLRAYVKSQRWDAAWQQIKHLGRAA